MATTPTGTTSSSSPGLRLRRSLTLWDLILYGIIVIQPTAPMPAYRVFSNAGEGHVVTSILIAMIAMVFTAMSYGRIAPVYPSMADCVCSNLAAPVGDVNSSRFGQSISPGRRSLRYPHGKPPGGSPSTILVLARLNRRSIPLESPSSGRRKLSPLS
jgi:hypothetical protein